MDDQEVSMSPVVERNKVVVVTYRLRNQQGEVVDIRDLPVAYVHGSGADLLPKVEEALEGRRVGERVTVTLAPEESFGRHDPGLTFTDDVENVPPELRRLGARLEAQNARGEILTFVVTRIEDGKLTVDANHPLAGQTITFDVKVEDVRDATADEIRAGRPGHGPVTLQ
jgi:FKBP-type peptidyl-prolyl cis-trans isomerase SlyD